MFRELRDFQFPPRYSGALNFGYGYPLFNFTYPLPYYLGILFYIPFHSFVTGIKTLFALSVFLSAFFMYASSSELWKSRVAGIVSAILYIYLPYRMVDLYVRGSIGESISLAIFPLIFYLTLKLFSSPFSRSIVVLLSISVASLVLAHNIMTVLFFPVLITFTFSRIISEKRWDVLQTFSLSLLLGVGISFYFWFPALFEKGNILLSKIPIADRSLYFVQPLQLIIPSWGYAPPTEPGGFSYQLGIPQIFVVLISSVILLITIVKNKLKLTPAKLYSMFLLIIYFVCLALMFRVSSFVWKLPLLNDINYPWTLLAPLGFLASLISGNLTYQAKYLRYSVFVLCAVSIILVLPYAKPSGFVDRGDNFYLTNEATTTSSQELMPLWVTNPPTEHFKDKVEVMGGDAKISNLVYNSKSLNFNYSSKAESIVQVNTIYYPGWKAYTTGEEIKINHINPKGVIQIPLSQYRDRVSMRFEETPVRFVSDLVSILTLLVVSFILLRPLLLFKS
jgi:hypothetical protein